MVSQKLKLVIFDMDGVIIDSEPYHERAKHEILMELGVEDKIDLGFAVGKSNLWFWEYSQAEFGFEADMKELEFRQYMKIISYIEEEQPKATATVIRLMEELYDQNIMMCIASSSDRIFVDYVVSYTGIKGYLAYTVAGDEVPHRKPAPDLYLNVLAHTGIDPDEAYVIEDSESGYMAATSAGIDCLMFNLNKDLLSKASLEERWCNVIE